MPRDSFFYRDVTQYKPRTDPQSSTLNLLSWAVLAIMIVALIGFFISRWMILSEPSFGGASLQNDFSIFWAVGRLVLVGEWMAAFDQEKLTAARQLPPGAYTVPMYWFYPPVALLMVLPLGTLSYFWSWVAFSLVSFGAFSATAALVTEGWWMQFRFLIAAPACAFTLKFGQITLVICVLFVFAFEALRRDRPVLAGLCLALMTIKPHLGILIPLALIAGRSWTCFWTASIATVAMSLLSLPFVGVEYWSAYLGGLGHAVGLMLETNLVTFMSSIFALSMMLDLGDRTALILQYSTTVVVASSLVWVWSRRGLGFDLKLAALCFATVLATPYSLGYDLVFPLLGAFYLARTGFGRSTTEKGVLVVLWALPAIGLAAVPFPGISITVVPVLAAFGLCVAMAFRLQQKQALPAE